MVPIEETNEDNEEETKRNEKANKALIRFRKSHEKRKKEEEERKNFPLILHFFHDPCIEVFFKIRIFLI